MSQSKKTHTLPQNKRHTKMYLETWSSPKRNRPIYDVTTIGYPIMSVVSIISCLAIICITIKHEQFRKPSAVSTISWCIVTLVFTAFVLPVTTNNVVTSTWTMGEAGCKVWLLVLYFAKTARGLLMAVMVTAPYMERLSNDRTVSDRAGYLINFIVCLLAIAVAFALGLSFAVTGVTSKIGSEFTVCVSNSSSVTQNLSIATSIVGTLIPCLYSAVFLIVVSCQHRNVPKYPGTAILVIVVVSFTFLCVPGETLFIMYRAGLYVTSQDDDVFNCLTLVYFSDLAMSPLLCLILPWSSYKTIRSLPRRQHGVDETATSPVKDEPSPSSGQYKEKLHPRGHLRHVAMYGRRAFTQHTADLFLGKAYTKSGRAATYF